ncbi:unnamed protein product [Mycena citricolor]|uniref:Uncharacterized protein n=1 Tax=Mycena citricolor TaxID=2018698 RepID=A0AAD2HSN6_9AGAR|nr:unnamed protein product [Mycena citricolor]
MSLDQNLFTLIVTPSAENPHVVDLIDPQGRTHYRKQRVASVAPVYKIEIYDRESEALLVTATAPSAASKTKVLELCNPTSTVELRYTGTLSFRWGFKWEDHEFEWKREECFMLRKPDPPVLVAVTREPPGRLKTTSVQILDYNLNRFEIDDRKGLEIVMLTALMTFQDANDLHHTPEPSTSRRGSGNTVPPAVSPASGTPPIPLPPPKPPKKLGIDRIAEMQAMRGQFNEVSVEDEGSVEDYGLYCANLFHDDAMLFISILSAEASQVPKVLQVVEEAKRIRHKAGITEELHQYVLYDTLRKGPRRINLDDADKRKYTPPESLIVHLSKIPMPELQPQAPSTGAVAPLEHERTKKDKDRKKEGKRREDKKGPSPPPPPPTNKLMRPPHNPGTYVHTPSPSQLNNPGIYVAPPPPRNTHLRPRPDDEHHLASPSSRLSGFFGDLLHRPRSAA